VSTLRDRCQQFRERYPAPGILELLEFVMCERGRSAAPELDGALPLVLYFETDADRQEFVEMVREVKPTMVARKVG
jgi:hypothetical protein